MLVEMTVFCRQQSIHQQIRETTARHKQTLLTVWRRNHGDQARIKTEETELTVVLHIDDRRQMIAIKGQTRAHLPFFAVREIKRTADHLNAVGLYGKLARTGHFRHLAILGRLQQLHHLVLADGHVWLKVDHSAINCRGQLPDLAINTAMNFLIEINAVNGDQHGKNDSQF